MSEHIDFAEYQIEIRSKGKSRFEARVMDSPLGGRPWAPIALPIAEEALDCVLRRMEWRLCYDAALFAGGDGSSCDKLAAAAGVIDPKFCPRSELDQLGETLFAALFPAPLVDHFRRCQAAIGGLEGGHNRGIRLRLAWPASDEESLGPVAACPWELLTDPESRPPLAQRTNFSLVRFIDAAVPTSSLRVQPPIRVLLVAPEPKNSKPLALEREQGKIESALGNLAGLEVERLQPPTLTGLQRRMRQDPPIHVVHFMGHGQFSEIGHRGYLFFEREDRSKDQVPTETFVAMVQRPDVKLIVLNSCKGAKLSRHRGVDAFKGIASELSLRGIPAVVAMQFSISDAGAIRFAEEFYQALGEGRGIEEAVIEGRLALLGTTEEWMTPVLYLRFKDGRLIDRDANGAALRDEEVVTMEVSAPQNSLRIGVRSLPGATRIEEALDRLLPLDVHFEGRRIRQDALWNSHVAPELFAFLEAARADRRHLFLDFAAHQSVAFAAGWHLEAKSGVDVTVRQWGMTGMPTEWRPTEGEVPEGALWEEQDEVLSEGGTDVALAIGVTQEVQRQVREFIGNSGLPVHRLLSARIVGGPSQTAVKGGAHALALAQQLVPRARSREPQEREGRLHIFGSAPNAFFFYLGQLSRVFGPIQLYEFNFEKPQAGDYWPSIQLPLPL